MPELPEVETVRRGLARHITGSRITHVVVRRTDLRQALPARFGEKLAGRKITRISRRAKYILVHLEGGLVLIVHLGMSGSLILKESLPEGYRTHDHIIIECSGGMWMVFHDPRRFGLMLLAEERALAAHPLFKHLGPEPLSGAWNAAALYKSVHGSRAPIKSAIMDQRNVVGVGNIYACEALFRARIHPERPANKVSGQEAVVLARAIKAVLKEAIISGGSTLRDYVRSSGDAGYFQHCFRVYGRKGLACNVCHTPVSVIRQSGRSSFFCKKCQR